MNIDRDKIDTMTLALLHLVIWNRDEQSARAWKGFEWETMNRLHQKGYIGDPRNKAKSVVVTPEGCTRAKELFDTYFMRSGESGGDPSPPPADAAEEG